MRTVYVVKDDCEAIMTITRNPHTEAGIYFRERQKLRGFRPYVWEYILGVEYDFCKEPRLVGHDELAKFLLYNPSKTKKWSNPRIETLLSAFEKSVLPLSGRFENGDDQKDCKEK